MSNTANEHLVLREASYDLFSVFMGGFSVNVWLMTFVLYKKDLKGFSDLL